MEVQARPQPFDLDIKRTAVIVVDMQNDFAAEQGMFARAGIDVSMIRAAVAPTAKVIAAARQNGIPIVYLKMGFLPDLSDAGLPDSPNRLRHMRMGVGDAVNAPDGTESRVLIRDTWNTDIVNELRPEPGDMVLYKHRYSGFYQTGLDDVLKERNIRQLVFTGCTTSVCVESTIRDAMFRDYSCLLLEDCAAEPIGCNLPRSNHDASLLVIQTLFGWVGRSAHLLAALEAHAAVSA